MFITEQLKTQLSKIVQSQGFIGIKPFELSRHFEEANDYAVSELVKNIDYLKSEKGIPKLI